MPQTPIQRALAAATRSLEAIGTNAPTFDPPRMLDGKRPTNEQVEQLHTAHQAVYDYYIVSLAKSYFDKRREASKNTLERLGILAGIENINPGDPQQTVWSNDHMQVQAKVNNPPRKIDTTKLITFLRTKGVKKELLEQAIEASIAETKAPTIITVVPVVASNGG